MTGLAGYLGEKLFFEPEKCLMGSSSDIREAWEELSQAFYQGGYVYPLLFSPSVGEVDNTGKPFGLLDETLSIFKEDGIRGMLKKKFDELTEATNKVLEDEKELIRQMALYLVKNRTMSVATFKNYIKKYSKTMNIDQIKKDEKNLNNYYLDALKKG